MTNTEETPDVVCERKGRAGLITLTRPKALNALNHAMIAVMTEALVEWRNDPAVELIVVRGEGRAFCAGGDIVAVYHGGRQGNPPVDFFRDEYRLNTLIANYPKPYVALIDGIVMGGGVGISCHGSHRVMTEKTMFAMPETGIGFFPDVGGSHFLSRLTRNFGIYLALTGGRIKQGDALWAGLATHAVSSERLEMLTERLCRDGRPDEALADITQHPAPESDEERLALIERAFAKLGVREILASLEAENSEMAQEILTMLRSRSPTSLEVALRQVKEGDGKSMEECMIMEYRIAAQMLKGNDFYEGVRALLVDKDNAPNWKPASLEEVQPVDIDAYFKAPADGDLTF
ncbi:enoyl-CoA hydratase/isomerase family protein [Limoniibacter endophyticus]|uniref:3-hydroxyisobutyryl-CoA hydrolase n=1 Tax=Limoniibacter endophyticus TaxID=1565040 RepID=A0A8J3DHT6_9HYPH|nr:enoyl-CoA hydratase/isomerase family protein [Limoniibacter endophyticus]GHC68412.1 3-hydroxyisobutyryl-CoA hydrolase [Limoniibacter endophyticus]